MVRIERQKSTKETSKRFIVSPNASLTSKQTLLIFFGIAVFSLTISLSFAAIGLWGVLPFSGAELALLGFCLYYTQRNCSRREIITVTQTSVQVETGYDRLALNYECQRGWAKIDLKRSAVKGYPSRLTIRSHGREIEVGSFLVESEKKFLAKELEKSLAWHEDL